LFGTTGAGTVATATYVTGGLSAWTDLGGAGVVDQPAVAIKPGYRDQVVIRQGDGSIATQAPGYRRVLSCRLDDGRNDRRPGSPRRRYSTR